MPWAWGGVGMGWWAKICVQVSSAAFRVAAEQMLVK
jgi:hypothetical protein